MFQGSHSGAAGAYLLPRKAGRSSMFPGCGIILSHTGTGEPKVSAHFGSSLLPWASKRPSIMQAYFTLVFHPPRSACQLPLLYCIRQSTHCRVGETACDQENLTVWCVNGIPWSGKPILLFESERVTTKAICQFPIFKRQRNTHC